MTTGYVEQGALLDSRCFRPRAQGVVFEDQLDRFVEAAWW